MSNLSTILAKRKLKNEDPQKSILRYLEELKKALDFIKELKDRVTGLEKEKKEFEKKLGHEMKEAKEAVKEAKSMQLPEKILTQIKGDKGDKGDKGEKGEKGDKGDKGESIVGPRGDRGSAGRDGQDGKDGAIGPKGDKGDPGKDGSPDTPNDIAKKVNTLEEKIERKTIKGLEKVIESLQKSLQDVRRQKSGGGGGMGNPQHETFNGDGSTTSFTLSNNVAAGGKAAWVYMNGQFLVNSTHWSISGKTLTLTLTPTADEIIDITYIRS